jgi:hypothetical protein
MVVERVFHRLSPGVDKLVDYYSPTVHLAFAVLA